MKSLTQLAGIASRNLKTHSSVIFSVSAGVGTIFSAYLAGKASFKAAIIIRDTEELEGPSTVKRERIKERTKLVWKLYIPPAISTTSTILLILGANRAGARKLLASEAALSLANKAYTEYRDKVVEELGSRKDQAIRDKIATDKVKNNPPPSQDVLVIGSGDVLCCELYTGRYFVSNWEKIRKAVNDINSRMLKHDYATLDDLYYILGLNQTTMSGNFGWKSNRLLEISISTILTEDNRPCLTFEYNYTMVL
ncbi:MAG: DUF6353 family protein [Paenisporosarcina sp.]